MPLAIENYISEPPPPPKRRINNYYGVISTLGLSTLPLASYAVVNPGYGTDSATVGEVPVTVTVDDNIALQLSAESVPFGTVAAGTPVIDKSITATVTTNASDYTLALTAPSGTDLTGSDSNKIETGTTISNDTTKSAWGYKVGAGGWMPLTTEGGTIESKGALSQGVGETTVTFGVAVTANQAADTYTGSVTFTATATD